MKKISIWLLILSLIFTVSACTTKTNDNFKLAYNFNNLKELIQISPEIIECQVIDDSESFSYDGIDFLKTEIQVKDILRSQTNLSQGAILTILQTDFRDKAPLKKGKSLILFLEKYEGPIMDNAYVVIGEKYGHLEIKEGKIYSFVEKDKSFFKDVEANKDLSQLKGSIKNTEYKSPKSDQKSKEEIEKANEREKQMEREAGKKKQ